VASHSPPTPPEKIYVHHDVIGRGVFCHVIVKRPRCWWSFSHVTKESTKQATTSATIDVLCIFQMYSPKYSKAQSCAYFCSKNVLVALNSLYIVSTRVSLLILGDKEATLREVF